MARGRTALVTPKPSYGRVTFDVVPGKRDGRATLVSLLHLSSSAAQNYFSNFDSPFSIASRFASRNDVDLIDSSTGARDYRSSEKNVRSGRAVEDSELVRSL